MVISGLLDRFRGRDIADDRPSYPDPVVIFGTGGSGTRVLQLLVHQAGYFMGTNLNAPGDSLDIGQFIRRWLRRYLRRSEWIQEVWRGEGRTDFPFPAAMADDFAATIDDHREGMRNPDRDWGWKVPRTILMLPFVNQFFPGMKAIHLVRDGRDMAYSRNDNQVWAYGPQILDASEQKLPAPIRSMTFWAMVNVAAARYGERNMGERYLRLRYEDVCADPRGSVLGLLGFLGSDASRERMQQVAAEEVQTPSSIGRWRQREPDEIAELAQAGDEALRSLGYE